MAFSNSVNPFKIFFSHSSINRGFSAEIYEHLRCMGIPVWFSPVEMPSTGVWYTDEEIESKLRQAMEICDSALVLTDDYTLHSRWVNYEIKIAEKIAKIKPDFKLIPLINSYPKELLPEHFQKLNPIDFNHGYMTALRDMLNRLNINGEDTFSVMGIKCLMVGGSRYLQNGIDLKTYLEKAKISIEIKDMILEIRNYLAQFSYRPSIQEITRWLSYWCSDKTYVEPLVEGNQWYSRVPKGDQYGVIFSYLPTDIVNEQPDDGMTPAAFLITIVFPQSDLDPETTITILAQYGADRSAYFWIVFQNNVFRFSMGSENYRSILLSENRLMGASRMVLNLYQTSLNAIDIHWKQMIMNKMGQGMVQDDPNQYNQYRKTKILPDLVNKLKNEEWDFPQTSQNVALWGHLTHGGILIYEVSRETGICPTISQQINLVVKSAGAQVITISENKSFSINISFSLLQSDEILRYSGISPDRIVKLTK